MQIGVPADIPAGKKTRKAAIQQAALRRVPRHSPDMALRTAPAVPSAAGHPR
jgi:hypothetical protein